MQIMDLYLHKVAGKKKQIKNRLSDDSDVVLTTADYN